MFCLSLFFPPLNYHIVLYLNILSHHFIPYCSSPHLSLQYNFFLWPFLLLSPLPPHLTHSSFIVPIFVSHPLSFSINLLTPYCISIHCSLSPFCSLFSFLIFPPVIRPCSSLGSIPASTVALSRHNLLSCSHLGL